MKPCGKTCVECKSLGPLLVDYADAATCQADSIRLERHLAACEACRTELAALRRSLGVLESVWAEPYMPVARHARPQPPPRWRLAAALCGVAAAIALAFGVYRAQRAADDPAPVMVKANQETAANSQFAAADEEPGVDDLDIDAFIQRREQSARLAASVQFLTSLPVEPEDAERAQRYLRDAYGVERARATQGDSGEL